MKLWPFMLFPELIRMRNNTKPKNCQFVRGTDTGLALDSDLDLSLEGFSVSSAQEMYLELRIILNKLQKRYI